MVSLTTSLYNCASALQTFEQSLSVSENNVTNSQTPGYARQVATLESRPFDVSSGQSGGVYSGPVQSTRDAYLETTVQQEQSSATYYSQQSSDLSPLQSLFDLTGTSGISGALNGLFQSFSALSVNPNDTVARQNVLTQASSTAEAFNQAAAGLNTASVNIDSEATSTVNQINQLAQQIADVNTQRKNSLDGSVDAGADAQLYSDLESLSQLTGFTTMQQSDGSLSVYLGGQTPLVTENQALPIQVDTSTGQIAILDANGIDITSQVTNGQLGALVNVQNNLLPSYMDNLNTLASTLADQVNTTLGAGVDQNGNSPATELFAYDPTEGAANTLSVNPMTPDQIAAALPSAPSGNGNALALSALSTANVVNGYSFTTAFGNLGEQVGNDISNAQSNATTQSDLLTQAQNQRNQVSGVNLDTEAMTIMQFQQAYNATAKMLGIVSEMTQTLMDIFQPQVSS